MGSTQPFDTKYIRDNTTSAVETNAGRGGDVEKLNSSKINGFV
jgi:hypothetical protein